MKGGGFHERLDIGGCLMDKVHARPRGEGTRSNPKNLVIGGEVVGRPQRLCPRLPNACSNPLQIAPRARGTGKESCSREGESQLNEHGKPPKGLLTVF